MKIYANIITAMRKAVDGKLTKNGVLSEIKKRIPKEKENRVSDKPKTFEDCFEVINNVEEGAGDYLRGYYEQNSDEAEWEYLNEGEYFDDGVIHVRPSRLLGGIHWDGHRAFDFQKLNTIFTRRIQVNRYSSLHERIIGSKDYKSILLDILDEIDGEEIYGR